MDPPPLHPNDDDPAAPEPYLPLMNDDKKKRKKNKKTKKQKKTEPSPVPFPPPKEPYFDFEPKIECQNSCPPPPFNNNSYRIYDDDQSVSSSALPQQKKKKKKRHMFSGIGQKSSSNNNLDLKGHVVVKVRTTTADIIKLENNTRIIPEEEAVCRFCFHQLFPVNNDHHNNNDNVLETKCLCPFTLTHEHCATEWSGKKGNTKCDVCDQDTIYIPVTLSTPPLTSEDKPDKGSSIITLEKWGCFGTG